MQSSQAPQCRQAPTVSIIPDEFNNANRAVARLNWQETSIVGRGLSRDDAGCEIEQSIGQKLAVARALSHLARQLFADAARDIEVACTLEPA